MGRPCFEQTVLIVKNKARDEDLPVSYQMQQINVDTTGSKQASRGGNAKTRMKATSPSRRQESDEDGPQHELTQIRRASPESVDAPLYGQVISHVDGAPSPKSIDIDDAVESLGMGRFQYRILLAAGLCFAADSMEVLLLSFLSVVLKAVWKLSDQQTATITSSVFVGALLGTLVLGYLGDRCGRKPIFTLTAAIICIAGFATATANDFMSLVFFRFTVGFGVGGLTVPFDTLAEFVPNSHRGSNLLLIEYFWTAGTLLVPILAYFSFGDREGQEEEDWRIFVVLCGIPCLFSCIASIMFVPESPRWLLTQHQHDKALDVLRKAAKMNGKDPDVLFPLDSVLVQEAEESESFCDLFQPAWLKTTLLLWVTWAGFAFAYYGTIIAVTLVFSVEDAAAEGGDVFDFDYGAIFASASAEVVGTTLVLLTIDKVGRIPSQVVSYAFGGFSVFAMCLGAHHESTSREFLICTAFLARMFFMSATCTTWVSTAEILTTEVRTTGHSSANAVARIFGAFSPFVVSASTPFPVIGSILLAMGLVTATTSYHLPETKGRGLGLHAPVKDEPNVSEPVNISTYVIV